MKQVKKPTKSHKGKKTIKAHQGMAHVPKKGASTAGQITSVGRRAPPTIQSPDIPDVKQAVAVRQPKIPATLRNPVQEQIDALKKRGGRGIQESVGLFPSRRRPVRQPKPPIRQPKQRDDAVYDYEAAQKKVRDAGRRASKGQTGFGKYIHDYLGQAAAVGQMDERARRRYENEMKSRADERMKRRRPIRRRQPVRPDPWGGTCPSPDTLIGLSNNKTKQAGKLAVGDMVYTQHENTLEWGDYAVSHVSIVPDSERLKLVFDTTEIVCSLSHKMYVDNKGWTKAEDMESDDVVSGHTLKDVMEWEAGDVVKITVEEAHSYIAAGLLSHNKTIAYAQGIYDPRNIMKKGGAVKKKYAQVKTMNNGGYVSRAKYGVVDNLKKKK
jgi:hypothetical protein